MKMKPLERPKMNLKPALFLWLLPVLATLFSHPCPADSMAGMDMNMDMGNASMKMNSEGKALADSNCAACHGPQGISTADNYPNLAGQMSMYLSQALQAYRDKSRVNAMMNAVAAKLTDAQINDLAMHYASLKPAQRN